MSASKTFSKSLTPRLLASSLCAAALGLTATAHAAEAESPYVQLYKNSTNTTANNTASDANNNVPGARISSTRTIKPASAKTATQSANTDTTNTSSENVSSAAAANSETAQPAPTVRVTTPIRYKADAPVNGVDLLTNNLPQIPTPQLSVADVSYVPTVLIPKTKNSSAGSLDVSLIDDFITEINPHARHYPPNFNNVSQRYYSKIKLKEFEEWLRPYADAPDASYDVLLRASKLNSIGRNLDLGSDFAVRASTYVAKAISRQPNSAEANFLYGMMLSEGGGFKEGNKYLEKAASLGYLEAEQSLAQTDLLTDRRPQALARLRRLSAENPDNQQLQQQINIVENGDYYIWNLPTSTN